MRWLARGAAFAFAAGPAARAAVVLAHPHPQHGGTMHTKAVYQSAKALTRIGCAVLRFNFRGVGASEGEYGEGIGEQTICGEQATAFLQIGDGTVGGGDRVRCAGHAEISFVQKLHTH